MRHDYIPIILEDVKSIFFLVLLVNGMIVYQMILYRKNNVKKLNNCVLKELKREFYH